MSQPTPTVFVVDDDLATLRLTSAILADAGFATETFETAEAFLEAYRTDRRGCIVLDVCMPGMGGLALQERLNQLKADIPVLLLTGTVDVPTAVTAMKKGALDVVEKPFDRKDFVARVTKAVEEDARRDANRRQRAGVTERLSHLSLREREVMDLVVGGLANKQVAAKLGISEKTVEVHRSRVMQKMQAGSVAELVRMSMAA